MLFASDSARDDFSAAVRTAQQDAVEVGIGVVNFNASFVDSGFFDVR